MPKTTSAAAAGLLCSLLVIPTTTTHAENWPQWRGPTGNGISTEENVPVEWSRTKNVAWRTELPGPAGATPVVWDDRIFLTSVDGEDLVLLCLNTDGERLWSRKMGVGNRTVRGDEGNMASPSPVTDGKHVWAAMGTGDVACYDFDGNEVWSLNLQERYGKFRIQFGWASTPVLADGRLFLQVIHGDGQASTQEAYVVALDATSGREVWKRPRVTGATNENEHSYASPILYDDGRRKYLVTHGADYTIAHRLRDGAELWRLGGLNPQDDPDVKYHRTLRFVASPAANEGMLVIPTAKDHPVFAIPGDKEGRLTAGPDILLWTLSKTPDVPSPLIKDGLVYLCMQNGNLYCIEAETGRVLYQTRTHVNRHRASPVYADGHVYLTSRDGIVSVVAAGPEFELAAQNNIGEAIAASPVISNGTLYLRSFDALWAIRAD